MAQLGPLNVRIVVDDTATLAQLRSGRRELNQAVKRGLFAGAEEFAVPAVRERAPYRHGRLRASVSVRATTGGVYLTSALRGKKGRYVGLLNYGGTLRRPILPLRAGLSPRGGHARALPVGPGGFVRRVDTPRVYRPRLFFERGRDAALPAIDEVLAERVAAALAGTIGGLL